MSGSAGIALFAIALIAVLFGAGMVMIWFDRKGKSNPDERRD